MRSHDASTIQLFLSFASQHTRDNWLLSELPRAELVFVPAGDMLPPEAAAAAGVWVGPLPAHPRTLPASFEFFRSLSHPLQLDAFIALLRQVERADAPLVFSADQLPALAAASAPRQVGPAMKSVPTLLPAHDPRVRFHLKHWPSANSLSRHRYLPRLASFLSARYLSVAELAALSNVSPVECEAFLDDMAAQRILEQRAGGAGLALRPAPPAPDIGPDTLPEFRATEIMHETQRELSRETPLGGLMQRLRSRLGLL